MAWSETADVDVGLKPCGQDGFVRDFAAMTPPQSPLIKGGNKPIGGKGIDRKWLFLFF